MMEVLNRVMKLEAHMEKLEERVEAIADVYGKRLDVHVDMMGTLEERLDSLEDSAFRKVEDPFNPHGTKQHKPCGSVPQPNPNGTAPLVQDSTIPEPACATGSTIHTDADDSQDCETRGSDFLNRENTQSGHNRTLVEAVAEAFNGPNCFGYDEEARAAIRAVADAVENAYHVGYFCNVSNWLREQCDG